MKSVRTALKTIENTLKRLQTENIPPGLSTSLDSSGFGRVSPHTVAPAPLVPFLIESGKGKFARRTTQKRKKVHPQRSANPKVSTNFPTVMAAGGVDVGCGGAHSSSLFMNTLTSGKVSAGKEILEISY